MNEEEIKKIIDGTYDDSREDTLLSMVGQLYSQKMVPSMDTIPDYVCRHLCLLHTVLYFQ